MITLREIRLNNHKSGFEMARKLGINPRTFYSYELHEAIVPAWVLIQVCSLFNVDPREVEEAYIRKCPDRTCRVCDSKEAGK